MFAQLKPLIELRALTLTVTALPEGKIRVCVVPQSLEKDKAANEKIGYSQKDEVAGIPESALRALTAPLALTGTAEELDSSLPDLLANYVEKHLQLKQTFDQACQEIAEAVDAIKERDKNKQKGKKQTAKYRPEFEEKSADDNPGGEGGVEEGPNSGGALPLFSRNPEQIPMPGSPAETNITEEVKQECQ